MRVLGGPLSSSNSGSLICYTEPQHSNIHRRACFATPREVTHSLFLTRSFLRTSSILLHLVALSATMSSSSPNFSKPPLSVYRSRSPRLICCGNAPIVRVCRSSLSSRSYSPQRYYLPRDRAFFAVTSPSSLPTSSVPDVLGRRAAFASPATRSRVFFAIPPSPPSECSLSCDVSTATSTAGRSPQHHLRLLPVATVWLPRGDPAFSSSLRILRDAPMRHPL